MTVLYFANKDVNTINRNLNVKTTIKTSEAKMILIVFQKQSKNIFTIKGNSTKF